MRPLSLLAGVLLTLTPPGCVAPGRVVAPGTPAPYTVVESDRVRFAATDVLEQELNCQVLGFTRAAAEVDCGLLHARVPYAGTDQLRVRVAFESGRPVLGVLGGTLLGGIAGGVIGDQILFRDGGLEEVPSVLVTTLVSMVAGAAVGHRLGSPDWTWQPAQWPEMDRQIR